MGSVKSLAKDTAIYGMSSIVGRFLNWLLVPLYTIVFAQAQYGIVTFVYAVVAIALIILTYGMETGFFRFANHERWHDPMQVYSTALISLAVSSTVFVVLVLVFLHPLTEWMGCGTHTSYIWIMAVCVAIDAFTALPFSYLRYRKRPVRFAVLRLVNIGINIGLNLFFILLCPWLMKVAPGSVDWFYVADYGIGYIFLANLIASAATLLMLIPELHGFRYTFCVALWREMICYSAPLLLLGIAGIMNQTLDKILFPFLYKQPDAMDQLGIYGANYKIAILMVMFIQAFRFAYEPFIFAQNKEKGDNKIKAYSDAMKFFIIMGLCIFLGVMFYLGIIKYFISPKYFSGLKVVPIVMLAEFFFGILFNLSVWYKLSDKTMWGAWISLIGLVITVIMNVLLVPKYGYMGCAWAAFSCYFVMMVVSYVVGQKHYPISYPIHRIVLYTCVSSVVYALGMYVFVTPVAWVNYVIRTLLLCLLVFFVAKRERLTLSSVLNPILSKIRR